MATSENSRQTGLLPTPTTRDWKDTGDMTNVPTNSLLGRVIGKMTMPSTFSRGGSRANRSASPENKKAIKTTVTFGRRCFESSATPNPLTSLAKTLLESSTWHSTKCALTWKVKATPSSRSLFQLAPSAHRIVETECGLLPADVLPTPRASKVYGYSSKGFRPTPEQSMNAMLPTPAAKNIDPMYQRDRNGNKYPNLASTVTLLPTPRSVDGDKNVRTPSGAAKEVQRKGLAGCDLPAAVTGTATGARLRLQPAMTEWMMGFPKGWCDFPTVPKSRKLAGAGRH